MSVLLSRRSQSKAEFINTAYKLYAATINFLTRLSARYSRVMAAHISQLAGEVQAHTEKANAIYPSDAQRKQMRKTHLLEARASLMALDAALTMAYTVLSDNPQGAFTDSRGKTLQPAVANKRLEKLTDTLGNLIDQENRLLKGALEALKK